jgi:signal peptidase I
MDLVKYILQKIVYGGGIFFDLAKWLIVVLLVFVLINTFFVSIYFVDGESMSPNFADGEMILWDKNAYQRELPKRNDIVVVNYPGDPNFRKYVKRIIALPGETVQIKGGKVFIDGKKIEENFLSSSIFTEPEGTWKLNIDQYFVMGDNRPNSNDSRFFGPVQSRFINGRSLAILWPRFRLTKDI